MAVEINVKYDGELYCTAVHKQSGTTLKTEAPLDNGGKGELFSPTDLVATALGTCILTILGLVAQRHELDIRGTRAHVVKEMATAPLRRIGKLTCRVEFPAHCRLEPGDRERLERAAERCPVTKSLHPDVQLSLQFFYGMDNGTTAV